MWTVLQHVGMYNIIMDRGTVCRYVCVLWYCMYVCMCTVVCRYV